MERKGLVMCDKAMQALLDAEGALYEMAGIIECGNHMVDVPSNVSREAWRVIFNRLHDLHAAIDAAWITGMKG
jgi:hypothetical protein